MDNKKSLLLLALLLAALLLGGSLLYRALFGGQGGLELGEPQLPGGVAPQPEGEAQPPEDKRIEAPDFSVQDREGNAVSLSDFSGRPVLLNFWASWCGPCRQEMPDLEEAYRTHGEQVTFMMVNLTDGDRETQQSAEDFLEEGGYTFPAYFDTEGSAAGAYVSYGIPITYFIDAEGYAVAAKEGVISKEQLERGLRLILPAAEGENGA
ncbi:MAG: TlpA family protein disulfide reductase [Clostridiales bacterium]|nr:TlpA family protein disulfide reductase [Clostridiales bacterium]